MSFRIDIHVDNHQVSLGVVAGDIPDGLYILEGHYDAGSETLSVTKRVTKAAYTGEVTAVAEPLGTTEKVPTAMPGKSATKAEWVNYAVDQGMALDDADAMTKDALVTYFTE